jgi:hypothetical protein
MPSEFKERVVLLMAVLSNYNFLRASAETTHLWVRFLTDQTSADNLRLVKMVLAVILACPNLLPAYVFIDDAVLFLILEINKLSGTNLSKNN